MKNKSAEEVDELLDVFDKLIAAVGGALLVILTIAYFLIPQSDANSRWHDWHEFGKSIITNLIPALLATLTVYLLFRRVQGVRVNKHTTELAAKIKQGIQDAFQVESSGSQRAILSAQFGDDLAKKLTSELHPIIAKSMLSALSGPERGDWFDEDKREIVQSVLEATGRAIMYPKTEGAIAIRAFCHLSDEARMVLRPYAHWIPSHREFIDDHIPYNGPYKDRFIIARAFNTKQVVADNLPADHIKLYPSNLQSVVPSDLKFVIAAPIRHITKSGPVIGTICFDSTTIHIEDISSDWPHIQNIMYVLAHAVFLILTQEQELTGKG